MKQVTIVMYHYVRELRYTKYPKIKGLLASQFREQLLYMQKYYEFVTVEDCIRAVESDDTSFPNNAILLTFDDGYIDHYTTVFPLLDKFGIQGCFFPPAKTILHHEVLDVNKIHFTLAAASSFDALLQDVFDCLNRFRAEYGLESNDYYFAKLAVPGRLDPKEVIFVKRLLQLGLPEAPRKAIVDYLFKKYVAEDEAVFSRELYMDTDQIQCMIRNGMFVGGHGYDHCWLNSLSSDKQEQEIDQTLEFLKGVGAPTQDWVMCYPYGAYDQPLMDTLKKKQCSLAMTTHMEIASLNPEQSLTLARLDTNYLPKVADSNMAPWTQKALNHG